MSRLIRLKFDTSQANLSCFIRKGSKITSRDDQKTNKKKTKSLKTKPVEFLPETFLTSVLTQGLAEDFACEKDIKQLIHNKINQTDQIQESRRDNHKESSDPYESHLADPCIANMLSSRDWAEDWQQNQTPLNKHISNSMMVTQQSYIDSRDHHNRSKHIQSQHTHYSSNPQTNLSLEQQQQPFMVYYPNNIFYQQDQHIKHKLYNQQVNPYEIILDRVQQNGKTTIMIKNIPNKYTYAMLLEELNRNHKHKYNLFYLPIDYNNNCNVGYAFVNFIHTKFIRSFYEEFNGRKWNKFISQKICSLTYARIQGATSLINYLNSKSINKKTKPIPEIGQEIYTCLSKIVEVQKQEKY